MKKRHFGIGLLVAGMCVSAGSASGAEVHWTYSGSTGPAHWGELDAAFSTCSSGRNQSPINLTGMVEGELPRLNIDYRPGGSEILNNGHTVQITYVPGNTITIDGHAFELKQFHFHSPSENAINGHSYPMEAHFVHSDKDGTLAVIALMFREGEANAELAKAWAHMPARAGNKNPLSTKVDANALLPHNHDYYRYNGSLTTPPCSEGVWWMVMKYYNTASKEQIEKFSRAMPHPNNRPHQPVNARIIVQ